LKIRLLMIVNLKLQITHSKKCQDAGKEGAKRHKKGNHPGNHQTSDRMISQEG